MYEEMAEARLREFSNYQAKCIRKNNNEIHRLRKALKFLVEVSGALHDEYRVSHDDSSDWLNEAYMKALRKAGKALADG